MPYHKFVFDKDKRKFLGEFEGMYKSEEQEGFDSWNISNLSILSSRIHLEIINSYNFNSILDFGCGKGALTHLLKKRNNRVMGLDISKTAIDKAKSSYGEDIIFDTIKDNNFTKVIESFEGKIDLTICLETLSYIKNWREVVQDISSFSRYFYVSLYIPENPIGFVLSNSDLIDELNIYYNTVEKFIYNDENTFFLGRNKKGLK